MQSTDTYTPLSVNDFSFHGFESLLTPLAQSLSEVGIRRAAPDVSIVENAVFVPTSEIHPDKPGAAGYAMEGAIVTSDGQPIVAAQSRRRAGRWGNRTLGALTKPIEVAPNRQVDEEVIYLGWYFGHFGHFLLESLSRMWVLPELDSTLRVVFHTQRRPVPSGTTLRILEAFGVPLDRILFLDSQTALRRVIIPEPLYELSHSAHELMPRPYRTIAASMVTGSDQSNQPIYLSRRLLPSGKRPIVGEYEMEEVLRENGFLIVHPETMTFEDQVRMVNRHRDIYTSDGSAAYMPLFSLTKPRLHFLTSGIPFQDYFLVSGVAQFEASFSNSLGGGVRPPIYYAPPLVEIDKLCDYLDSVGQLKSKVRSSLLQRGQRFRLDYDEAWFYTYMRTLPEDQEIASDIKDELIEATRTSWPLSWILARYYAVQNPSLVDQMARQFIDLVLTESDIDRLVHFYADVARAPLQVMRRCSAETRTRLSSTLTDRFLIDPADRQRARVAPR